MMMLSIYTGRCFCPMLIFTCLWIYTGKRYCPMLVKEGGCELLETLSNNPEAKPEVARIAGNVLTIIKNVITQ